MTDREYAEATSPSMGSTYLEFGGLRFDVSFRSAGATMRVEGKADGVWTEMLRFDDFIDGPHFHAPASGRPIPFDRASLGEPLAWYVLQIRDHLTDWLETAGFADISRTIDVDEISANVGRLTDAMNRCVPDGYLRVPGVGLQRVAAQLS